MRRDGSQDLEATTEGYLEKQMRKIGGRAFKFPPAVKGNPDRIVIFPHGPILLVEMKRVGEKPSPAQELWHQRMRDIGHEVYVLYTKADVDMFITAFRKDTK